MLDGFHREIDYLRLSVTDQCNYRCIYCMPPDECIDYHSKDPLSTEQLIAIARTAVDSGIRKIRITGGEPLVRRDILDICRGIAGIDGLKELCLTTNGSKLTQFANDLKSAGVSRLNISLNTLDAEKYKYITRNGELSDVLDGVHAAEEAGFQNMKFNTVLLGGINDDEIPDFVALTEKKNIEVRFIELMPMGECACWDNHRFISTDKVLEVCPSLIPIPGKGVARHYHIPGYAGIVGLISPISGNFCSECSRIRITADGMLKPCLHSSTEISLRGLSEDDQHTAIRKGILQKPQRHHMDQGCSDARRGMNEIGG